MNRRQFCQLGSALPFFPLPALAANETPRTAADFYAWMTNRFALIGYSDKAYEEWTERKDVGPGAWAWVKSYKDWPNEEAYIKRAMHSVYRWDWDGAQDKEAELVRMAVAFFTAAASPGARMLWRREPAFEVEGEPPPKRSLATQYLSQEDVYPRCSLSLRCWIEGIKPNVVTWTRRPEDNYYVRVGPTHWRVSAEL